MYLVSADEMRAIDKMTIEEFGIPGRVLMENAGREAARIFIRNFEERLNVKIGVAAGSGNNGGDGFVISRYLFSYGYDVTLFLFSNPEKIKGEAKENLKLLYSMNIPVIIADDYGLFEKYKDVMSRSDIWIDAILGTGLKSEVKEYSKKVIEFINGLKKPVFAIDIPSGLNSDTGMPNGISIRAEHTVTFGLAKIGEKVFPGAKFSGRVEVADIGIPAHVVKKIDPKHYLITSDYVKSKFLQTESDSHKGDFGHLLVIAGSTGKTGAAILTATAAMRSGAGLVTLAVSKSINPIIEASVKEAMTYPLPESEEGIIGIGSFDTIEKLSEGKNCIAIGPGLGTDKDTEQLIIKLIEESRIPVIIDADALNAVSGKMEILKNAKAPLILTPHPKEMARLINKDTKYVQKERVNTARGLAEEFGVTLVLKGAGTVVALPDGRIFINSSGNRGMASGGTGDVLTGVIAGLTAFGYTPDLSAVIGVYIHGAAGDRAARKKGFAGLIASDIIEEIPYEMKKNEMCD